VKTCSSANERSKKIQLGREYSATQSLMGYDGGEAVQSKHAFDGTAQSFRRIDGCPDDEMSSERQRAAGTVDRVRSLAAGADGGNDNEVDGSGFQTAVLIEFRDLPASSPD